MTNFGIGPYLGAPNNEAIKTNFTNNIVQNSNLIFCVDSIKWNYLGGSGSSHYFNLATTCPLLQNSEAEIYLGIDLLHSSRDGSFANPIPDPVSPKSFSSNAVKKAYISEVLDMIATAEELSGRPVAYVALVMEQDFYYYTHPEDYDNLVDTLIMARAAIKETYPQIKVGTYFTLKLLWVNYQTEPNTYNIIIGNEILNDPDTGMDFLGGSSYCHSHLMPNPEDIPDEFFDLPRAATSKPFHLPEVGWPSTNDEEEDLLQNEFMEELFNRLIPNDTEVVIWFVGSDLDMRYYPTYFESFKYMGLWDILIETFKPAWDTWLDNI